MLEVPATFGKYFLTEKIAIGGMAEIYLAKLLGPGGFEKHLVIKLIHPRLGADSHFVDMFVAEAKTLVGLTHGNIVPVYELGVVDDTYFIAMEYIDGPTLYRLLERVWAGGFQLEAGQAAHLIAEILKGLDYAHRKGEGVIHRDLSPRNVMVSRDGEVKLVDFGIAIAGEDDTGGEGAHPVGSYPYMSPEQARGEPLTAQSDLFSVGVLLWEMLTGRQLFARDTAEATLEAVLTEPIARPQTLRATVPERLERAAMKALARDRNERYESARDFLSDINRFLYSLEPPISAVEVAALVARHCPPEVHRPATVSDEDSPLSTATDGAADDDAGQSGPSTVVQRTRPVARQRAGTTPVDRTTPTRPTPPANAGVLSGAKAPSAAQQPSTPAVARPNSPKGKSRAPTMRSFATHVEFERVLARATPLFPIEAILDEPPPAAGPSAAAADASLPASLPPAAQTADRTAQASATSALPPSRGKKIPIAIAVAFVCGLAGVWLAQRFLSAPTATVAPTADAAPELNFDAAVMATAVPADAGVIIDAAPIAMAATEDARTVAAAGRRDGGGRGKDAAVAKVVDGGSTLRVRADAGDIAAAKGVLTVGANPWGEVYDGDRKLGRTPGRWELAAGRHTILVRFPVEGNEQERSFSVEVIAGQTVSLGVVEFKTP